MKYSLIASLLLLTPAYAQTERPASVQATATATVSVIPDQAQIQIGVVSTMANAADAASRNASVLQVVIDALKPVAGPKAEVKTASYSLTPNYDYPKGGGAPTLKGYTANNLVQVTTTDLASVGKIIDIATKSGANEIHSLSFTLKDPSQARTEALRKAAMEAHRKVEAMAGALALKLGKVLYLDEAAATPIRPVMYSMAETVRVANTPIQEPQSIDVQATVTLTVALAQ